MRLYDAARMADTLDCYDAYTGAFAFKAQLALYDDVKRDSETAERRILSVAPGVEIPARRTVEACGTRYIVGHGSPDYYNGAAIRVGFVAHEATTLGEVKTLGQTCLGTPGAASWCGRVWVKNKADHPNSSDLTPQYHVHFASVESSVTPGKVLLLGSELLIVRTVHFGPAGTRVALADSLGTPTIETAEAQGETYEPLSDSMMGWTNSAPVLRFPWQSWFSYDHASAPKFEAGDLQLAVAKSSLSVVAGTKITLADGLWVVRSAIEHQDAWLCRVSRNA